MILNIEIYQSSFNGEWNCDITTKNSDGNTKQHWAVDDFCALLRLITKHFPKAEFVKNDMDV